MLPSDDADLYDGFRPLLQQLKGFAWSPKYAEEQLFSVAPRAGFPKHPVGEDIEERFPPHARDPFARRCRSVQTRKTAPPLPQQPQKPGRTTAATSHSPRLILNIRNRKIS